MTLDPRAAFRELFRKPFVIERHPFDWIPRDPSDSWAQITPYWGYDHLGANLMGQRLFGRVVRLEDSPQDAPSDCFALISLKGDHDLIPPHPGQGPNYLDDYAHPNLVFSDGSLGCWDPRNYPQMFDRRRPWLGYHSLPLPTEDSHRRLENRSAVEYYDFSGLRSPHSGGCWKYEEIKKLLKRRDFVEESLRSDLIMARDALQEHYGPCLPYFDPLTIETALRWSNWPEGRDCIGRTQRYIAELVALKRWLAVVRDPSTNYTTRNDLTGVWIGTVSSNADWTALQYSPLPIFSLLPIPQDHPLYRKAEMGNLDNDERYRVNALDFALSRHTRNIAQFGSLAHECRPRLHIDQGTLPLLINPPRQILPPHRHCTAWDLSYASYPYLRHTAPPPIPHFRVLKELRKKHQRENRDSRSPQILPPNASSHLPNPRNHPILAVLPGIRSPGNRATYFTEEQGDGFAWAIHVSQSRAKRERWALEENYKYYFEIGDNIFLWADNPLPDDPTGQFGLIQCNFREDDNDEDFMDTHEFKLLKYIKEPLSTTRPPSEVVHVESPTNRRQQIPSPRVQPQAGNIVSNATFNIELFREVFLMSGSVQSASDNVISSGNPIALQTSLEPPRPCHQIEINTLTPKPGHMVVTNREDVDMATGNGLRNGGTVDSPRDSDNTTITASTPMTIEGGGIVVDVHLKDSENAPVGELSDHRASGTGYYQPRSTQGAQLQPQSGSMRLDELLERVHYQRGHASSFLSSRLCTTFSSSALVIPVVTLSTIPSTNLICYGIRVANVAASLSIPMICHIAQRDQWGDIVAIASIREPDSTITVDIGFRFPEDALIMCSRNGIKFEGRYMCVQPVSQLGGICYFPSLTFSLTNSGYYTLPRRSERLSAYLSLEALVDDASPLVLQMTSLSRRLHEQLASPPLEKVKYRKENLISTLEALHPIVTIHKIIPPPPIARTIYITRNIPAYPHETQSYRTSSSDIPLDYQQEELQFDHVIPNKPIPRRAQQRMLNGNDLDDPSSASSMNSRERFEALRLVFKIAKEKHRVWNSLTIPLPPPPTSINGRSSEKLVGSLVDVWKWYDDALERAKAARDLVLADPQSPMSLIEAHDAAVDAFSIPTRRFGVFGPEYNVLQSALWNLSPPDHAAHEYGALSHQMQG